MEHGYGGSLPFQDLTLKGVYGRMPVEENKENSLFGPRPQRTEEHDTLSSAAGEGGKAVETEEYHASSGKGNQFVHVSHEHDSLFARAHSPEKWIDGTVHTGEDRNLTMSREDPGDRINREFCQGVQEDSSGGGSAATSCKSVVATANDARSKKQETKGKHEYTS